MLVLLLELILLFVLMSLILELLIFLLLFVLFVFVLRIMLPSSNFRESLILCRKIRFTNIRMISTTNTSKKISKKLGKIHIYMMYDPTFTKLSCNMTIISIQTKTNVIHTKCSVTKSYIKIQVCFFGTEIYSKEKQSQPTNSSSFK